MRGICFLRKDVCMHIKEGDDVYQLGMKPVSTVHFSLQEGEVAEMQVVSIAGLLPSVAAPLSNGNISCLSNYRKGLLV